MRLKEQMPLLEGATEWINKKVTKEQLVGRKPTLIHFWSVSCDLCKESLININYLRNKYYYDLNVVAVHMPLGEEDKKISEIKAIANKYNLTQPIFVDNDSKLSSVFNNKIVPTYYVFDKNGKLRHIQSGGRSMHMLEKRIDRVIFEMRNAKI